MQTFRDTFLSQDRQNSTTDASVDKPKKRWILNAFNMSCAGHMAPGLWKHPDDRSTRYHDIENWTEVSKLLERGKFNGMFIADVLGAYDIFGNNFNGAVRTGAQFGVDDPLLVISACAAVFVGAMFISI